MPVYEYRHRTPLGRVRSGTIIANSPRHARDQLREQRIAIDELRVSSGESSLRSESLVRSTLLPWPEVKSGLRLSQFLAIFRPRHQKEVSWFVRELSTLLSVGTPMAEALELTAAECSKRFQQIILTVRESITSGNSLESSLRRHRRVFEPILCEMIAVGEQAGSLHAVLTQAAKFRDRRDRLKDKVFSAILYPSLVFLLSIGVTLFLMTFVVPTLISSLQELQRELPWPTRLLKACSDLLISYGTPIALGIVALTISFGAYIRSKTGRWQWDGLILKIPILGNLVRKQNCSRLCMVVATLLQSGVELVRALEIAEDSITNTRMKAAISAARDKLVAGTDVGTTLRASAVFPAALAQVFILGQNSGQLDLLLFRIAEDYDHQVATLADRLTTIVEPLLIVGLSIVVGFILMATLLPILETGNALSEY